MGGAIFRKAALFPKSLQQPTSAPSASSKWTARSAKRRAMEEARARAIEALTMLAGTPSVSTHHTDPAGPPAGEGRPAARGASGVPHDTMTAGASGRAGGAGEASEQGDERALPPGLLAAQPDNASFSRGAGQRAACGEIGRAHV